MDQILDREQYMVVPRISSATWDEFREIQLKVDRDDDSSCLYLDSKPGTATVKLNQILCTESDDPESEPWAIYFPMFCEIWIQSGVYDYARNIYLEQTGKFLETEVKA